MTPNVGLARKLGRAFLIQVAFISITGARGVYATRLVLQEILIKQALVDEAAYYLQRLERDSLAALPDTRNLRSYWADDEPGLPEHLQPLGPGYHQLRGSDDFSAAYVVEHRGRRLVLEFKGERVGDLVLYFGLVPLGIVLVVLYSSAWIAYRSSRRAVSPLVGLAREVEQLSPEDTHPEVFDPERLPQDVDQEVRILSRALHRYTRRIEAFIERERQFTRDASHELRTPITVIRMASSKLLDEPELSPRARATAERIQRAARDMEELVSSFLLLARESEGGLERREVCLNTVVQDELERIAPLLEGKPVRLEVAAECRLLVNAWEKALAIVVGNLLRNAVAYTAKGSVRVLIRNRELVVEDSGEGIAGADVERVFQPFQRATPREGGHGLGLAIVRRMSERFGWPVDITSQPGVGTRVTVSFVGARREELGD